jgi:uncharacterized metal-binding protein YceD (DUF177 family)
MQMEIDLTQLTPEGVRVRESVAAADLAGNGATERGVPVRAELTAWVRPDAGGVRATGAIDATVRTECDRCLKPVEVDVAGAFDQRYVWSAAEVEAESEVEPDALDVELLESPVLDTRALAREQLELSVPIRIVCSEDCAGLCPICRIDRNVAACACESTPTDPRWEALKKLKN